MLLPFWDPLRPTRIAFTVHDGNLVRPKGLTERLPKIVLPEAGIKFICLEINKETDFKRALTFL
jgi:hypothetical protein